MNTSDDIQRIARSMLGTIEPSQEDVLTVLCSAAESELSHRLRAGIAAEDCYDCFIAAAALLTVSALHTLEAGGITSFDAGTVSLTLRAEQSPLAQAAERMIAPWCEGGFCFRSVRT